PNRAQVSWNAPQWGPSDVLIQPVAEGLSVVAALFVGEIPHSGSGIVRLRLLTSSIILEVFHKIVDLLRTKRSRQVFVRLPALFIDAVSLAGVRVVTIIGAPVLE